VFAKMRAGEPRPYGWCDERDAKNSVSAVYFFKLALPRPLAIHHDDIIRSYGLIGQLKIPINESAGIEASITPLTHY
jgi:hypothetical protein